MEIKNWLKDIGVGMVKNGHSYFGFRTLKLAVSQGVTNEINWFLVFWYKLRKAKSFSNTFWVIGGQKWVWSFMSWGSKTALSQEWIYEMSWFFACWNKFRKTKSYFNKYWVDMVKNGRGLIDHGTLKWGVSHKLFDELSRSTEWFLRVDSSGTMFQLTCNPLFVFGI